MAGSTNQIARLESELRCLRLAEELVEAKGAGDVERKRDVAVTLREARRAHRVAFVTEAGPGDAVARPAKIFQGVSASATAKDGN